MSTATPSPPVAPSPPTTPGPRFQGGRPGAAVLSRSRVESAIARVAAVIGVVYLLQSIPVVLAQYGRVHIVWFVTLFSAMLLSLLCCVVASIIRRWVKRTDVAFAFIFLVAMVSWPFAVRDASPDSPWIYYLLTIAATMAAIGLRPRHAAIYLVSTTLIYAVIRVTPAGGGLSPLSAALDSIYSLILGAAVLIIATMLRAASTSVDIAQATALERYSEAVREHALEAERMRVDAIVHDSVLTTLLSAARAELPEAKRLSATMAGNAIGHLREAVAVAPDVEGSVAVSGMAAGLSENARTMVHPVEIRSANLAGITVPIPVAEALNAAAVQAMVNSQQHAGETATRWVQVDRMPQDGIRIRVGDDGVGFDPELLPSGRMGVRVSILERVTAVGGRVDIQSAPGRGTIVSLEWPV